MMDYWAMTGDEQHNSLIRAALQSQVGHHHDYLPRDQNFWIGNDDQAWWALAAMTAAETKLRDPDREDPQWLELAQKVFLQQKSRWDDSTCSGGLRWQIHIAAKGYGYKNSISNALFFQLAARLGRYTGDKSYLAWARKTWNWLYKDGAGLITHDFKVWDGWFEHKPNCSLANSNVWSPNFGAVMVGAAYMYDQVRGPRL